MFLITALPPPMDTPVTVVTSPALSFIIMSTVLGCTSCLMVFNSKEYSNPAAWHV